MPKTIITFNGLLVFCYDPQQKLFEVGVLRARAQPHSHILQITVKPNPRTGDNQLVLDPNRLEAYIKGNHLKWNLDVELNGQTVTGLEFNAKEPTDRLDPTAQDDFGW